MKKRKLINKKINRLVAGHCQICKNSDTNVLENHRIIPGKNFGEYTANNTAVLCACCHASVHRGSLKIIGWFDSTGGRVLLIEQDGKEKIIPSSF